MLVNFIGTQSTNLRLFCRHLCHRCNEGAHCSGFRNSRVQRELFCWTLSAQIKVFPLDCGFGNPCWHFQQVEHVKYVEEKRTEETTLDSNSETAAFRGSGSRGERPCSASTWIRHDSCCCQIRSRSRWPWGPFANLELWEGGCISLPGWGSSCTVALLDGSFSDGVVVG